MSEIPTVEQRLAHCRTLVDEIELLTHDLNQDTLVKVEIRETLAIVEYELAALAKAMDGSIFCRACASYPAPDGTERGAR